MELLGRAFMPDIRLEPAPQKDAVGSPQGSTRSALVAQSSLWFPSLELPTAAGKAPTGECLRLLSAEKCSRAMFLCTASAFILISLEAGRGRGLEVFVLFREVLEVV